MPQQPTILSRTLAYCALLFLVLPLLLGSIAPFYLATASDYQLPLQVALLISSASIGFLLVALPILFLIRLKKVLTTYLFLLLPISATGLITQLVMFNEFGTEINQRFFEMFEGNLTSVWKTGCQHYHIQWIIPSIFLLSAFLTWLILRHHNMFPSWWPRPPRPTFYLWLIPIFVICGAFSVALRTDLEQVPGYTAKKLSRAPLYQWLWLSYELLTNKDTGYRNILEKVAPVKQGNYHELSERLGKPPEQFTQQHTQVPTWLKKRPSHVFLFLLESFGNNLITHPDLQPLAPNLNRLAREGLYTKHFWSSGYYTMHAIHSVIPGIAHTRFSESPKTLNIFKLDSLPRLMKRAGYTPLFFCASHGTIASKKDICLGYGYDAFLACPEEAPQLPSNEWGVCDGDFFTWSQTRLNNLTSPHFITFLNVSNHAPYDAPVKPISFSAKTLSHFGIPNPDDKLLFARHIHYADAQLMRMVQFLAKRYPNALFVFTGDHGNSKIKNSTRGPVPFILWNPHILDTNTSTSTWRGSQMDIVASLAQLTLPNNSAFTTLGRPVWDNSPSRISVTYNTIISHDGARDLQGKLIRTFKGVPQLKNTPKQLTTPLDYAKKASAIEALSWGYLNSKYLKK